MRTKKCYIIFQLGGKKLCGHLTNWSALSIPSGWDNDEILPTDFYCGKMEGDGLNLNSFGCGPDGSLLESQYALSSYGSTGRFFALNFRLLITSISALNGLRMTWVVQIHVCRIDFWNLSFPLSTVVSYSNESVSFKWELPIMPLSFHQKRGAIEREWGQNMPFSIEWKAVNWIRRHPLYIF